ncbi:multicopper oxidase domain-containing protein [Saccharothrix isguenensis]
MTEHPPARPHPTEPLRAWRDTVDVPPRSTVMIAVPLSWVAGRTAYQCHATSHEDMGMMGVLEVSG